MRYQITAEDIKGVFADLEAAVIRRLNEKGHGAFVSSHEALGVVTEEYHEVIDAIHANDHGQLRKELLDVAVPCLVGVISIDSESLEF